MGIYLTPEFEADRKDARISDAILLKAAKAIVSGLHGDHLGKYTYKKRLALPAVSPRDGARAIVFFHHGQNVFFLICILKVTYQKRRVRNLKMTKLMLIADSLKILSR